MNRTSMGLVITAIGSATMVSPVIGTPPPLILIGLIATVVGQRMFFKAADPELGISQAPIAGLFFAIVIGGIILMGLLGLCIIIQAAMLG